MSILKSLQNKYIPYGYKTTAYFNKIKKQITAGHGAGVTIQFVDCTIPWDETHKKFLKTKCHAIFTSAYDSIDTKTDDRDYYSDAFEVELEPIEGYEDSVTILENDKLYDPDTNRPLVLSLGYTRTTYKKGDVFDFKATVHAHRPVTVEGTARFTDDGADAFAALDNHDEESDDL